MDSWIRLIRVMTHEIMNSIAPVTSLTDTLLYAFRQDESEKKDSLLQDTVEALQTINSTAKGLISFVNSYRRFTGIPKPQLKAVSLQSLIERVIVLEAPLLEEKKIPVTLQLPAGPIIRQLDESQVMQVLLNLLKNATEAFSDGKVDDGEDRKDQKDQEKPQIRIELAEEKEKIYLDVYNNGQPISEEVLPNIFVPFFTTKDTGTGIGLSVSRYIMRLQGGTLTHFTKEEWTAFRMTFFH